MPAPIRGRAAPHPNNRPAFLQVLLLWYAPRSRVSSFWPSPASAEQNGHPHLVRRPFLQFPAQRVITVGFFKFLLGDWGQAHPETNLEPLLARSLALSLSLSLDGPLRFSSDVELSQNLKSQAVCAPSNFVRDLQGPPLANSSKVIKHGT